MTSAPPTIPREALDIAAGHVMPECPTCDAPRGAVPVDPSDLAATTWRCTWWRETGGHLITCPDCGDPFTYLHDCGATR